MSDLNNVKNRIIQNLKTFAAEVAALEIDESGEIDLEELEKSIAKSRGDLKEIKKSLSE